MENNNNTPAIMDNNNTPQKGDLYTHKRSKKVWAVTRYTAARGFRPEQVEMECSDSKGLCRRNWTTPELSKSFKKN